MLIGSGIANTERAFAGSMLLDFTVSSHDLRSCLERFPFDPDFCAKVDEGCDSFSGGESTVELLPTEPSEDKLPAQFDLAPVENRNGGSSSNDSSQSSGFAGGVAALLERAHAQPGGTLIAWLRIELSLDIPAAPASELLRPPQTRPAFHMNKVT